VDGGKIKNIETHLCYLLAEPFAVFKGAVSARLGRAGSRKGLVPSTETGFFSVHDDDKLPVVGDGKRLIRVESQEFAERFTQRKDCGRVQILFLS
jgi:hypothetical protein